jgi:ribosomal protein S18 acetylase RimI-like enzyme
MNDIVIRSATINDAEMLRTISIQTFCDTYAAFNSENNIQLFIAENFSVGKISAELTDESIIILLALMNGVVIGYIKLRHATHTLLKNSSAIEIARLYVLKQFIGKGIGKILMHKSFSIAAEKNKQTLWLMVWERNINAIEFYKRSGFIKFGEDEFFVGKDKQTDWLMMKQI